MKLLISADWHFSDNPIDAYRFRTIETFVPRFIKKYRADALLYLGDLCEAKDFHASALVNRVVKIFHDISELAPVILVQGNHDWLSSPDSPYFGFLSRLERVYWVGRPTPLADVEAPLSPVSRAARAILLPHTANYERDWGKIDFSAYDWAFCHQSFAGALADSGYKLPGGVPLSFFPPELGLVSGDIHRPQTLGNLTYCGSPYAVDFGDEFEPRMLLLDLETDRLTALPCPGPAKRLVEVKCAADLKKVSVLEGDVLKVRVTVSSEETAEWATTKDQIREWAEAQGAYLHFAQPIVIGDRKSMMMPKGQPLKTDKELLAEYAHLRAVGSDTLRAGLKYL